MKAKAWKEDASRISSRSASEVPEAEEALPDLPTLPEAPSDQWQEAMLDILVDCESKLWDKHDPISAIVRKYLAERGLSETTLQDHYVGYNTIERTIPKLGLWMLPGITIHFWHEPDPNVKGDNGTLYGVNVRLSKEARANWKAQTGREAKYLLAKGSKRAPIGLDTIRGKSHVFVLEGEFDAMLISQVLKALGSKAAHVGAFTMGSASSRDIDGWLMLRPCLLDPARYMIATDSDGAGQDAARYWLEKTERARHCPPPSPCKDVTELWQKHGYEGVRWWVLNYLQKYSL